MMATVLVPIPSTDFDPTETAVPWAILRAAGHRVCFATPDGRVGAADDRMVNGTGLGPLAPLLRADTNGRAAYAELRHSPEFGAPLRWDGLGAAPYDALLLPGGHAPGMKSYLESPAVQAQVSACFAAGKPVGAICHGVLVAARARSDSGRSVLHGRRTTALIKRMELSAWALTCAWLGNYYRTYPLPVEDEVGAALATRDDFLRGPMSLTRDSPTNLAAGFTVRDGAYLSARWPGDAHRFGHDFAALLAA
ncbi:MAG: type 1 glutamine amidotransferase domain-containing protein [Deltaproteobacteria bacterium]|nr:type 1 glutamine amidotransferase domain-containing protein [Deltaproteobacteria bacterium]